MQVEQPAELGARVRVVVDPQVGRDVVETAVPGAVADHQQGGGLPAATVAAREVTGPQGGQQPAAEDGLVGGGRPTTRCIAASTSGPASTLPCMLTPRPTRSPAQGRHASPVCAAALPSRSTRPTCRWAAASSSSTIRSRATSAVAPSSSRDRASPFQATFASAWVATAPMPATAAGTTDPTARNFEATATPHDSPSSERATMEKVMRTP